MSSFSLVFTVDDVRGNWDGNICRPLIALRKN